MKWVLAFFGFMIATAAMALTINGEMKKALLEKLTSDPTAYEARIYYNTTTQKAKIYDGSSWADLGGATTSLNQFLIDVGSAANTRTTVNTSLLGDAGVYSASATAAITIASPGVVTISGHGLTTGKKIYFTTTGSLPTGLTAATTYYVIFVDANTFRVATTPFNALAGTAVNTSGSQSGVQTGFYGGFNMAPVVFGHKIFASYMDAGTDQTTTGEFNIRKAAATRPALNMYKGGTDRLTIGVNGSANDLTPLTANDDVVIRSNSTNIVFSADNGNTTTARINTNGSQVYGAADANVTVGGYFHGTAMISLGGDCLGASCSIDADYGNMLNTVTRTGDGSYTLNFTSSFWSAGPACTVSGTGGGNQVCLLNTSGLSTTSYGVKCKTANTGVDVNSRFSVTCHGPR